MNTHLKTAHGIYFGWYVVTATFILLFAGFGCAYAFGAFFVPLEQDFSASRAQVSAVFSNAIALVFITGAFSGSLADKIGPRAITITGALILATGLFACSVAETLPKVTLYFTLGIGLGIGFIYVPSITTVQRWFTTRRGLASGIAVSGVGFGTLVLPSAVGYFLTEYEWRLVFVGLALFTLVVGLPASCAVIANPRMHNPQTNQKAFDKNNTSQNRSIEHTATMRQIICSAKFLQFYTATALLSIPIMVPFVHLVPYAHDIGIDKGSAATLLGLIGFGSIIGRLGIGALADRYGRKITLVATFCGIALGFIIWRGANDLQTLILFSLWFGTTYGASIAIMPALLADYFNGPKLSSVVGLQYTSAAFGALLGPIAAGYLFDTKGNYSFALVLSAIVCLIAAVVLAIDFEKKKTPVT